MGVLIGVGVVIGIFVLIAVITFATEGKDSFAYKMYAGFRNQQEINKLPKCEHEFGKWEDGKIPGRYSYDEPIKIQTCFCTKCNYRVSRKVF